jgi:hypothetical protein
MVLVLAGFQEYSAPESWLLIDALLTLPFTGLTAG